MKYIAMNKLGQILNILKVDNADTKISLYHQYMERILWWNEKVNLTSITDPEEFESKHFVDSLLVAERREFLESGRIVDVGTGGGFPGIPLAIAYPEKDFLLVDSLGKRLRIVSDIAGEMGIDNIEVLHSRAEDLGRNKGYRERFDLCVSRAVANFAVLSEYCLPLVKLGGSVIAYKGPEAEKEVEDGKAALRVLGGKLVSIDIPKIVEQLENYDRNHKLVVVKKHKKTPPTYPRQAGTPSKNPIK